MKSYLILAGSEGLGLGVSECLVRAGYGVTVVARDTAKLDSARLYLNNVGASGMLNGTQVETFAADISLGGTTLDNVVTEHISNFGRLDGVVINHGGPLPGTLESLGGISKVKNLSDVYESIYVQCVDKTIKYLQEKGGSVVYVSSLSVDKPIVGLDVSTIARGKIAAYQAALVNQYSSCRVRFNTVLPGIIKTPRQDRLTEFEAASSGLSFEEVEAKKNALIPMGLIGSAEQFGNVVKCLLSDDFAYVTGQFIAVDGGMSAGLI